MVEEVTLDSSVLVSALVKGEKLRPKARRVMEKIFKGQYHVTTSAVVPVEVCGSISRRAGMGKAISAKSLINRWEEMNFFAYSELTGKRREEAAELAIKLQMRGMDAIIVQAAKEKKGVLITFDEEMAGKAKRTVEVLTHKDF
ncbi:MAG: type II toxin-antitoxin system VapC family toxin [Candidatus Bathyarchaeia archaeon]